MVARQIAIRGFFNFCVAWGNTNSLNTFLFHFLLLASRLKTCRDRRQKVTKKNHRYIKNPCLLRFVLARNPSHSEANNLQASLN
jgi:hypothetical protein